MDSLLAGFGPGTRVIGWDSVPPADRPPVVWLIHLCFDVMVGLGFLLLLAGLWALVVWWSRRRLPRQRLFWLLGAGSGVAAVVGLGCGWGGTEGGREASGGADRRVDPPGVGGQPRLARLRPGHLLDRLPARVRRGDDRGRAAALARGARDRAARQWFRLP